MFQFITISNVYLPFTQTIASIPMKSTLKMVLTKQLRPRIRVTSSWICGSILGQRTLQTKPWLFQTEQKLLQYIMHILEDNIYICEINYYVRVYIYICVRVTIDEIQHGFMPGKQYPLLQFVVGKNNVFEILLVGRDAKIAFFERSKQVLLKPHFLGKEDHLKAEKLLVFSTFRAFYIFTLHVFYILL